MLECCFKGYTCIEEFETDSQLAADAKCAEWMAEGHKLMYVSRKIGDTKWIAKKLVRTEEKSES